MPDSNTQTPTNDTSTITSSPVSDPLAAAVPAVPSVPDGPIADAMDKAMNKGNEDVPEIVSEVASKVEEAQNILIALSSDPSVDELSAAIGLSLYLDKLGKHATAIYSGSTPNALEFLKPDETFESSADSLQDFVIALNKEKADHLRYKLDGDYVKIYITPYKTRIADEDLSFSYGDYNIDLVLALDVANGIDLDSALREHGRIMHDAVIVNITTGKPGKLGEIEWSDKTASSISEMIATLLYSIKSDTSVEKDEATALLTGIVAATESFSNASTTSETMRVSARLMESGADQQLIAKNITAETENEIMSYAKTKKEEKEEPEDPTNLEISHIGSEEEPKEEAKEEVKVEEGPKEEPLPELPEVKVGTTLEPTKEESSSEPNPADAMLDDLKAAAEGLSTAGDVATPVETESPIRIEGSSEPEATMPEMTTLPPVNLPDPAPAISEPVVSEPAPLATPEEEKTITPPADFVEEAKAGENKYGQMLEEALEEAGVPSEPVATTIVNPPEDNPAASFAPAVPSAPEVNGVPEINYMPLPDGESMPMPPTPPVDFSAPAPAPAPAPMPTPEVPSPVDMGGQPAMQDQVYNQQATNPGAFQIPGM